MHRMSAIFIAIAGFIAIISLLAYSQQSLVPPSLLTSRLTLKSYAIPEASAYFTPSNLIITNTATQSAYKSQIEINSTVPIDALQIELSYDPRVISIVSQQLQTQYGAEISVNSIDLEQGRSSLIASFLKKPKKSTLVLSFVVTRMSSTYRTEIVILQKSLITGKDSEESILKKTKNLIILFR